MAGWIHGGPLAKKTFMTNASKGPCRRRRRRPVAHPGRPLLHPTDGRDGRAGDQGRTAQGRRRCAGLRPVVNGKSTYFASVNRGKESIALDLKAETDRKIFEKLLEKADVIVENFRPGTMEKLGYGGWDTLHRSIPS